jgi:rubrerythrin
MPGRRIWKIIQIWHTSFVDSRRLNGSIARDFKKILSDLGIELRDGPKPDIKVLSTKVNLKNALDFELGDIDQKYPQFLERIKPEKHEAAIRSMTYAWETEKQHQALLQKRQ